MPSRLPIKAVGLELEGQLIAGSAAGLTLISDVDAATLSEEGSWEVGGTDWVVRVGRLLVEPAHLPTLHSSWELGRKFLVRVLTHLDQLYHGEGVITGLLDAEPDDGVPVCSGTIIGHGKLKRAEKTHTEEGGLS